MKTDLITIGDSFLDIISGPIMHLTVKGDVDLGDENVRAKVKVLGGVVTSDVGERRTNLSSGVAIHGGGSACNVAVATAKLNGSSGLITRVGNDEHGKILIEQLKLDLLDLSHIKIDKNERTGVSILLLTSKGARGSVTYLGANANLSINDIDMNYVHRAKAVLITNYYLLPRMCNELNEEFLIDIKEDLDFLSLDPGPIPFHHTQDEVMMILPLLKHFDAIFLTINEAKIILGEYRPREIVKKLIKKGVKSVIIKMGSQGSIIGTDKFVKNVSTISIGEAVDTTGAGDVYAAAYIQKHIRDSLNMEKSARFANVAASLKCMRVGRNGYPKLDEVIQSLKF